VDTNLFYYFDAFLVHLIKVYQVFGAVVGDCWVISTWQFCFYLGLLSFIFLFIYYTKKIILVFYFMLCGAMMVSLSFCCFCEVKQNTLWFKMGDITSGHTFGDHGIGTHRCLITHGFQPVNPVAFNIKNSILVGLRENQYDGGSLQDPYEHLSLFYESCLFCCPDGVTEDQKKL